ncbi:LysR family transcriptional regulator [Saccharopolyspora sp. NPDC050389]|uniref:LysR family transcriptional regulator n=1 Tax=Saccharopolyspora sp. NPDC050389 TaxID=3155516 RepID=UPI0033D6A392
MRYELTDLRLFRAIAEAESLSTGASTVFITASSASYRLKNLEHAMGTALFTRTARGMRLTPAGEALLTHVRELLAGVDRMHGDVSRFSQGLKGSVRLWANSSSLNGFILPSVSRFLLAHPDVNLDLEERPSGAIAEGVAAGEIDVGVLAGEVADSRVRSVRYAVDELVVVTPIDHPLARQREIRFGAALEFDFICMSRTSSNYLFLAELAKRDRRTLNSRLHVDSFNAVLHLVEAGVGVSLVPLSVAQPMAEGGQVAVLRILEPWAARELHLVTSVDAALPSFTQAFVDFLLNDPRVAATRAAAKPGA